MKKSKKRNLSVLIVIITFIIITVFTTSCTASASSSDVTYQSYVVSEGNLEKVVSGKGTLEVVDTQNISIPGGVKIDKVLIKQGMTAQKGDILAQLDIYELNTLQTKYAADVKELEKSIVAMDSNKSEKTAYSKVSGRVKAISKGEDNGDLIVIAVDGKMNVEMISGELFELGTRVQVKLKDGKNFDGMITSKMSGRYVIEISDNTLLVGENIGIYKDGRQIGEGTLQINAPIILSGDYNNVKKIHVKIDDKVSVGTKLITWKKAQMEETYSDLVAEYNRLRSKLKEIEQLIESPVIIAQQSGVISDVKVSDGDIVPQTSDYTPVFTQIIGGANQFEANISEDDVALIHVGQKAQIKLNAFAEKFNAEVTGINRIGNVSSSTTTFTVTLTLSKDERFLVGMNGKASFAIDSTGKSVILPLALVMEDDGGEYVYVTPSGDLTGTDKIRRNIITGIANDDYVQIVSGLNAGDIVLR